MSSFYYLLLFLYLKCTIIHIILFCDLIIEFRMHSYIELHYTKVLKNIVSNWFSVVNIDRPSIHQPVNPWNILYIGCPWSDMAISPCSLRYRVIFFTSTKIFEILYFTQGMKKINYVACIVRTTVTCRCFSRLLMPYDSVLCCVAL